MACRRWQPRRPQWTPPQPNPSPPPKKHTGDYWQWVLLDALRRQHDQKHRDCCVDQLSSCTQTVDVTPFLFHGWTFVYSSPEQGRVWFVPTSRHTVSLPNLDTAPGRPSCFPMKTYERGNEMARSTVASMDQCPVWSGGGGIFQTDHTTRRSLPVMGKKSRCISVAPQPKGRKRCSLGLWRGAVAGQPLGVERDAVQHGNGPAQRLHVTGGGPPCVKGRGVEESRAGSGY
jgi:hypothetical protein